MSSPDPPSTSSGRDDAASSTESAARAKTRVGQLLRGRFRLEALLGVGGMAAVYSATDRDGTPCAIKMLHPELSRISESRRRFLNEGYLSNRVKHPGAVSITHSDTAEDGSAYLVMDLLVGEPLDRRLHRTGPLPAAEVLRIADHLLGVLTAAHAQGIVHRDVKPGNVFLTRDGQVRLLDFGVARAIDGASTRLTQSGIAMGTPAFMAPEQARAQEDLDGRTDLWALGATMFMMLSGRQVHSGPSLDAELLAAMREPAPALATTVLFAPRELAELVDRALAFEKELRFPDAPSMQRAVRRVAALLEGGKTTASPRLDVARTLPGAGEGSVESAPPLAMSDARTGIGKAARQRYRWAAAALAAALVVGVPLFVRHAPTPEAGRTASLAAALAPPIAPTVNGPAADRNEGAQVSPTPSISAAPLLPPGQLPFKKIPATALPRGATLHALARGGDVGTSAPSAVAPLDVDPSGRRK
jgi:eukaryotic-like serine/threonine-protein kinase